MPNQFSRTELLIGSNAVEKLKNARVAVFGIGGVGGYVVEALIRSGLGNIDIVDNDEVSLTNLNRQIIATHSTIGKAKVDAMEERIKDINPDVNVIKHKVFYTSQKDGKEIGGLEGKPNKECRMSGGIEVWQLSEEQKAGRQEGRLFNDSNFSEILQQPQTENNSSTLQPLNLSTKNYPTLTLPIQGGNATDTDLSPYRSIDLSPINFDFSQYDYVVDAIDTVAGKLSLIEECKKVNTPIICAMGAGNKLDPTKFEVADISKTSVCPLARVIRQELKKRRITNVKVVFSTEKPIKPFKSNEISVKYQVPGSNAFCPSVMGLIIASEVVKDLIYQ